MGAIAYPLRVRTPPDRPILVYDGECRFCICWIRRWQKATGDAVVFVASQDAGVPQRFPEIPHQRFEESVQLIETDGCVHDGADAALRSLAYNRCFRWLRRLYDRSALCAACCEGMYSFTARHRGFFSKVSFCRTVRRSRALPQNGRPA